MPSACCLTRDHFLLSNLISLLDTFVNFGVNGERWNWSSRKSLFTLQKKFNAALRSDFWGEGGVVQVKWSD